MQSKCDGMTGRQAIVPAASGDSGRKRGILFPAVMFSLFCFVAVVWAKDAPAPVPIPSGGAGADVPAAADKLVDAGRMEEARDLLLSHLQAADGGASVSMLWRLSKITFLLSTRHKAAFDSGERNPDGSRISKRDVIAGFEQGAEYGAGAVALYEETGAGAEEAYLAYYWRGTNIGQQGNVRGLLASLFAIDDIRADMEKTISLELAFPDPYFVLCQMYTRVPGWSRKTAVELGSTALSLHEARAAEGLDEWDPEFCLVLVQAMLAYAGDLKDRHEEEQIRNQAAAYLQDCRTRLTSGGSGHRENSETLRRIDLLLAEEM